MNRVMSGIGKKERVMFFFTMILSLAWLPTVFGNICEKGDLLFRDKYYPVPSLPGWTEHTGVYWKLVPNGDPYNNLHHLVIESDDTPNGVHSSTLFDYFNSTTFRGSGRLFTGGWFARGTIEVYVSSAIGWPWDLINYKGPFSFRCDGLAEAAYEYAGNDIFPDFNWYTLWPDLQHGAMNPASGVPPLVNVLDANSSQGTATVKVMDESGINRLEVWADGIRIQNHFQEHNEEIYTYNLANLPASSAVIAIDQAGNWVYVSVYSGGGGGGGHGGNDECLRFDALIATPTGHKEIAAAKAGDQVMGWDGKQYVATLVEQVLVHDGTWTLYQYGDTWYTGNHKVLYEGKFVEVRTLSQVTQSYEGKVYHLLTATKNYCVAEPHIETATCIVEGGGLPSPVIRRYTVTTK